MNFLFYHSIIYTITKYQKETQMDFDEFTVYYPELYSMMDEDVRNAIESYPITGTEPLRDWDNIVDNIVSKYEFRNPYEVNTEEYNAQQYGYFRDGDRDDRERRRRRRRRRRFRDFDIRDIIRIIFLRRLFDWNRY